MVHLILLPDSNSWISDSLRGFLFLLAVFIAFVEPDGRLKDEEHVVACLLDLSD